MDWEYNLTSPLPSGVGGGGRIQLREENSKKKRNIREKEIKGEKRERKKEKGEKESEKRGKIC